MYVVMFPSEEEIINEESNGEDLTKTEPNKVVCIYCGELKSKWLHL